jgi:hypothetical protein
MPHPGKFALGAERHDYPSVEPLALKQSAVCSGLSKIETVAPWAVQVDPLGALKLGPWILRPRDRLSTGTHNYPHLSVTLRFILSLLKKLLVGGL